MGNIQSIQKVHFEDLQKIIPDLEYQFFTNPTSSLGFVRCSSWNRENTILIGDACHATVPFYGQGMNSGFEDCFLLNEWINKHHNLSSHKIVSFLEKRRTDTTAMQDLSMSNFVEMRDKTDSKKFLLQKKIEDWFSEKHPQKWMPLYSMVTFSDIGYGEAMRRGKIQDLIMEEIMSQNDLINKFDLKELIQKNIEIKILDLVSEKLF